MEVLPDFTNLTISTYSILFWSLALIQLFWLFFFYARVAFHKEKKAESPTVPISVIISARNEEDNLAKNLPYILEQDYPNFEVIVVNHQSVDGTEHILKAFQNSYPHLRVITLEPDKRSEERR